MSKKRLRDRLRKLDRQITKVQGELLLREVLYGVWDKESVKYREKREKLDQKRKEVRNKIKYWGFNERQKMDGYF